MAQVTIDLHIEWREVEPDGSRCFGCGDACLLRMVELVGVSRGIGSEVHPGLFLCGACRDVAAAS